MAFWTLYWYCFAATTILILYGWVFVMRRPLDYTVIPVAFMVSIFGPIVMVYVLLVFIAKFIESVSKHD